MMLMYKAIASVLHFENWSYYSVKKKLVLFSKVEFIIGAQGGYSAAGRTRRRLGNTVTCPYVRFDI